MFVLGDDKVRVGDDAAVGKLIVIRIRRDGIEFKLRLRKMDGLVHAGDEGYHSHKFSGKQCATLLLGDLFVFDEYTRADHQF